MSDSDLDTEHVQGAALGADLIIPVLAAAFTVYFLVDSTQLVWEARANGTVIGVVLLVLVAVQFVKIALALRDGRGTLRLGELGATDLVQFQRLALLAALAIFIALVPWLGTTLGLFLVMMATMWTLGVCSVRQLIAVALATAITFYLLFIALLQTRLPSGAVEKLLAPLFGGGA
jgi:hypothetical protein